MQKHTFFACCILIFCSTVVAQQPIKAPDSAPFYQLTNCRIEDDSFGKPMVVCDYKRTRRGDEFHSVKISARTKEGKLEIFGFGSINKESGEIRLSKFGISGNRSYNYEIYLVTNVKWADKSYGPCMVSNAVRLGNPGPPTRARAWNPEEQAAHDKHQLGKLPPKSAPSDEYEMATLSTNLLPGMYVMAGNYGEWSRAEFLGLTDDRKANLRFEGQTTIVSRPVEKWIAIDPKVLKKGQEEPESFKPSGVVLSGGTLLVPRDAVPLDYSIKLVPGTPLLHEVAGSWEEVILVKKVGTTIRFRMSDTPTFSRTVPITKLAIKNSVVDQLTDPDIAERFSENLHSDSDLDLGGTDVSDFEDEIDNHFKEMSRHEEKMQDSFDRRFRIRNCPIRSPIPRNCQIVPADLKIPAGTKVAACFHFDWSAATVVAENDDGTLDLDWADHAAAFNGAVARDQVIIQNKTLKKIKRDTTMTANRLSKIMRTWTDSSGQHTMEARFVKKTDTDVVLRAEDGVEKTVPIAKLSEEDQELIANLKQETENPFAR